MKRSHDDRTVSKSLKYGPVLPYGVHRARYNFIARCSWLHGRERYIASFTNATEAARAVDARTRERSDSIAKWTLNFPTQAERLRMWGAAAHERYRRLGMIARIEQRRANGLQQSQFRGVTPNKKVGPTHWRATFSMKGSGTKMIGDYRYEIAAALAFDNHCRSVGRTTGLNFPRDDESKRRVPVRVHHQRFFSRLHCRGRCGFPSCTYIATTETHIQNHIGNNTTICPVCNKSISQKSHYYDHYRRCHKVDENGGCAKHNVPPKRPSPRHMPDRFRRPIDDADQKFNIQGTWDLWRQQCYSALVGLIKTHIVGDIDPDSQKSRRWTHDDLVAAQEMYTNSHIHEIACGIVQFMIDRNMMWPFAHDDLGGVVHTGIKFQRHGGVLAGSLDRIDNDRPHFMRGTPVVGPGSNIRITVRGMNTRFNPGHMHHSATCAHLRGLMRETPLMDLNAVQSIVSREAQSGSALYNACHNIFTRDGYQHFASVDVLIQYTLRRLRDQCGKCEVTSLVVLGNKCTKNEKFMQLSVDARDATLGHRPGNIRVVCAFVNCTNRDKDKKHSDERDGRAWWTQYEFELYIGTCESNRQPV